MRPGSVKPAAGAPRGGVREVEEEGAVEDEGMWLAEAVREVVGKSIAVGAEV